ncbi:unnamed protein product [Symbiodinium sp. CCMP2592]|nr:unnamed protein product [Symbiodinium sp. CCMP2592]
MPGEGRKSKIVSQAKFAARKTQDGLEFVDEQLAQVQAQLQEVMALQQQQAKARGAAAAQAVLAANAARDELKQEVHRVNQLVDRCKNSGELRQILYALVDMPIEAFHKVVNTERFSEQLVVWLTKAASSRCHLLVCLCRLKSLSGLFENGRIVTVLSEIAAQDPHFETAVLARRVLSQWLPGSFVETPAVEVTRGYTSSGQGKGGETPKAGAQGKGGETPKAGAGKGGEIGKDVAAKAPKAGAKGDASDVAAKAPKAGAKGGKASGGEKGDAQKASGSASGGGGQKSRSRTPNPKRAKW